MKNFRSLKQSEVCFFKYFTGRVWKMGEHTSQDKFGFLPPEN